MREYWDSPRSGLILKPDLSPELAAEEESVSKSADTRTNINTGFTHSLSVIFYTSVLLLLPSETVARGAWLDLEAPELERELECDTALRLLPAGS